MEIEAFKNSAEEFVALTNDFCDKHVNLFLIKSNYYSFHKLVETYKATAAQTLELLCLHIDGTLTFVYTLISQILEESFKNDGGPFKCELMESFKNVPTFIFAATSEIRVETAFLILTVLHHLIKKRPEIMYFFFKKLR